MSANVDLSIDGPVARVTFESPSGVQVLSNSSRRRLAEVLEELQRHPELRVVVFAARGRTFIAGADINELSVLDAESGRLLAREGQTLMGSIAALEPVTIAAVHAACAGGGCELALACDLRMAAASARIGLPEVSLGLMPGWGGSVRAVRLFGGAAARRLILCGDLLPADEALRLGVVDSVSPDEEFAAAVERRLELLVSRGREAQRAAKRLIRQLDGSEWQVAFQAEAAAFARCCGTDESTEGTAAFLEKRPPRWAGT
ncbi:MAG: enoyl-CoA hydratase/isomerase family protein [Planctomycetes bacterium]|nr:enoyl-CoA hydratase/isomerase family protein [Planctomycetota bacterium]